MGVLPLGEVDMVDHHFRAPSLFDMGRSRHGVAEAL